MHQHSPSNAEPHIVLLLTPQERLGALAVYKQQLTLVQAEQICNAPETASILLQVWGKAAQIEIELSKS